MTLEELCATRGAGMSEALHDHACKAAKKATGQFYNPVRSYVTAAGDWCPECEGVTVMDNDAPLVSLTYCCDDCGHQWTPLEG